MPTRYVGPLSHGKAESMVKNLYDGVFLVREDSQSRGEYEICIRFVYRVIFSIYSCAYLGGREHLTMLKSLLILRQIVSI